MDVLSAQTGKQASSQQRCVPHPTAPSVIRSSLSKIQPLGNLPHSRGSTSVRIRRIQLCLRHALGATTYRVRSYAVCAQGLMAQFPQRLVSMAPPVAPGCAGALVLTQAAGVSVESVGVLGGAGVEPAGIMSPMMPPPPPCTPKAARHAATSSSDNSDNSDDSDDSLPSSQAYRAPHVRSQLRRQSSAASARSMFMSPTSVHGHADTGPRWMGCQLARGALLRLVCWPTAGSPLALQGGVSSRVDAFPSSPLML